MLLRKAVSVLGTSEGSIFPTLLQLNLGQYGSSTVQET